MARKVKRKWRFWLFGWEWKKWEILVGSTSFLSFPFKILSLQIREKIGVKSGKNIWTKMSPLLLTFLASSLFFSFLLTFPFSGNAGFLFLFLFFSFIFLWFCQDVSGGFFSSFFFFLFFFLRKHFWMISYANFWNVHFHLYTIFKKKV